MILKEYKWRKWSIIKIEQDQMGVHVNQDLIDYVKGIKLNGKDVIDGGSNIGLFSLMCSAKVGKKGKIHAFEIQEEIYKLGIENVRRNGKENVIHYHKALSNRSGYKVGFTHIDYNGENISSVGVKTEPSLKGQPHCGEVETIALDDMSMDNVSLIKLDLEGHEPQALDGMWATIDRYKPYLLIELSPIYLENQQQKTIDKIISHGYTVKELTDCNYVFEPI